MKASPGRSRGPAEDEAMGFYQSMFFKTWLVVAQNVAGPRGSQE